MSSSTKPRITDLTCEELIAYLAPQGIKPFRVKQLWHWIYEKNIMDLDQAANLPQDFLALVKKSFLPFPSLTLKEKQVSPADQTEKYLFTLSDGSSIETVLINAPGRITICLSSQVGCGMGCLFCASTQTGLKRNLATSEMVEQVLWIAHHLKKDHPINNIVYMGIGEPLLNYEQVLKSVLIFNDQHGLNIGSRNIMISTCGIIPGIIRLSQEKQKVRLCVSIHSAISSKRSNIMPINKKYDLYKLIHEIRKYCKNANREVGVEYILIKDLNDSPTDTQALIQLFKDIPASFNLIPYNPVPGCAFEPSLPAVREQFKSILLAAGFRTTLRRKKGVDINAACGQLRVKNLA